MPEFAKSIAGFKTGDLVFVRYPPRGTQPIHVTVFLDGSSPHGSGYLHAGDRELERSAVDTYAEYKHYGGYLHACTTDAELRAAVAQVASIFTLDARKTPYGHYPNKDDVARMAGKAVESPRANRFGGMIGTRAVNEIPFEFPALHRLLKWTHRALVKAPLSEHRGITCAAFAAACHQVAGMRAFFIDTGLSFKPELVRDAVSQLDKLTVTKESLRSTLEKIGEDPKTGKTIYKGQALRANSNRVLSEDGKSQLAGKVVDIVTREGAADKHVLQPWAREVQKALGITLNALSPVERAWAVVQYHWLRLPAVQMRLLSQIIDPAFHFDAKYVSSPALAAALVASGTWKTTEYTTY